MKMPCLTIPHCYKRAIGQTRSSWLTSVLFLGSFFCFCPEQTIGWLCRLAVTTCLTPIHPPTPASTAVTFIASLLLRDRALSLVPHTPSSFPQPAFYCQGWKSEILAFPASTAIMDGHRTQFWLMRPEGESPGAVRRLFHLCVKSDQKSASRCFLPIYFFFKF